MTELHRQILRMVLKAAAVLLALNEIRGIILTAPVFYALYQSGGSLMAIWLAVSSLLGIAASVIIPIFALRKLEAKAVRQ